MDLDAPPNVYRISIEPSNSDRSSSYGWQVRIERQNEIYTKYFSDSDYSSPQESLKAASDYRDELIHSLPDPMDPSRQSALSRSSTGVVGLSFSWKDDGSGTRKPYVQISWQDGDGNHRSSGFSVHKWDLRRAVWKACVRLTEERSDLEAKTQKVQDLYQTALPAIEDQYQSGPPDADS